MAEYWSGWDTRGRYRMRLIVNRTSYSQSANTSYGNWSLRLFGSSNYRFYGWQTTGSVTINGVQVTSWNQQRPTSNWSASAGVELASGSWSAVHDSAGYKTIGVAASFDARGVNSSYGPGSVLSISNSLALPRIPKIPAAPTPVGIDQVDATSFRYRFSGNDSGGAGVQEWQIQTATNSGFTSGVETFVSSGTTTITGRPNHATYWVRSRGRNSVGWGPYSSALSVTTLGHPTAPRNVSATPSGSMTGRIAVSWSAPATPGSGGIVGYNIFRDGTQIATTTGTGTGYTDTGRVPYQSYVYTVAARNQYSTAVSGRGPASSGASAVAPGPPSAPRNLTGVSDAGETGRVNLSWTAPVNVGSGGVTKYIVRLTSGLFIGETTSRSFSATGLVPGNTYTFRVVALNALAAAEGSESAPSNSVVVVPVGEPQAPTNVSVTRSTSVSNRLVISWTAPSGGLSGYSVFRRVNGADTLLAKISSAHTSFAVDNLVPGQSYSYVVRARTSYTDTLSAGYPGNWGGPASAPASATASADSAQTTSAPGGVVSNTNAAFNGTYVISAITANTIKYNKSYADVPAAASGGTVSNTSNIRMNGTGLIITSATKESITYSKAGNVVPSLPTSGGTITNKTNQQINGTYKVSGANAGARTITFLVPGILAFGSRVVPHVTLPPAQFSTITNLSNAVFNQIGKTISVVLDAYSFSYTQTGADVPESNAAGTVTNVTNRDVFNGVYLISSIPEHNILRYSRTAANVSNRDSDYGSVGSVYRNTSPAVLTVRFRSGWSG